MIISAIVAMSENRVIGKNNQLPWHLPADLAHFKKITWGKPIVMGRKTFQSIGRALPGRKNIVVTQGLNFQAPDCEVVHSLDEALGISQVDEIIIIGGAKIYEASLRYLTRLYLTIVHTELSGDVFFPNLDEKEWTEISREKHLKDSKNSYDYSFILLEKIGKS